MPPPESPASIDDASRPRAVPGLDSIRVASAVGIIVFHTIDSRIRTVAYVGLPAFLLISALLAMAPSTPRPWREEVHGASLGS